MALEFETGFPCKSCGEYTRLKIDHFQNTKWSMAGRTRADHFFPFMSAEEQRFLNERICTKCVTVSNGN